MDERTVRAPWVRILFLSFVITACSQVEKKETASSPQKNQPVTEINAQESKEEFYNASGVEAKSFDAVTSAVTTMAAEKKLDVGNDEIINNHRWGFAAFNPATNVIAYYTSSGQLLGQRQRE